MRDQLIAMFRVANILHEVTDRGYVVTRMHLFDGSSYFVETIYEFSAEGELKGIETNECGCDVCTEVGVDVCEDDRTLFMSEQQRAKAEELVEELGEGAGEAISELLDAADA